MARNDAEYRAHLRRAMRQERRRGVGSIDLIVAFVTLAFIGALAWKAGLFSPAPPQADYSADKPAPAAPPAPAYSAPIPTLQPAQAEIIGAQQPHAIRGAEPTPAPAQPAPEFVAPVELPPAAPVPTIDGAQAEIIGTRQSNGCAAGETFYPRVGCHATGSGGAMPGPVGED